MKVSTKLSSYQRFIILIKSLTLLFFILLLSVCFTNAEPVPDTISVSTGWNMIGSLSSGVALEILRSEPDSIIVSAFFAYNPGGGYADKDTLKKGAGYWVKVNADGFIIFGSQDSGKVMPCPGTPTVDYDGKTYNTVLVDTQCWLRENLDVGIRIDSSKDGFDNGIIEKICYHNDTVYCSIYGGLYNWFEAMQYTTTEGAQGICPNGWHIPTFTEFQKLNTTVDSSSNALKAIGQGTGDGAGTNTSGFLALLAGYIESDNDFKHLGEITFFWGSTEFDAGFANMMMLDYVNNIITSGGIFKEWGVSVRCLRD